jgi:hypothetical protein
MTGEMIRFADMDGDGNADFMVIAEDGKAEYIVQYDCGSAKRLPQHGKYRGCCKSTNSGEYDQFDEPWCIGRKLLLAPPLSLVAIWGN